MRILVVSNLYPPHYAGGYDLRCAQVSTFLRAGGHEVRVLTSSWRSPQAGAEPGAGEPGGRLPVERSLHHFGFSGSPPGRPYTLAAARRQLRDVRRFRDVVDEFRPDLVNWWNLEGLTKALLPMPGERGIPDLACIDDAWMIREYGARGENDALCWFAFWAARFGPAPLRPLLRRAVARWESAVRREGVPTRPFELRPRHVCFISEFRRYEHREAGLDFPSSEVLYGGVDPARFRVDRSASDFASDPLRLLYAGFIGASRGLHTAIRALALLPPALRDRVELSVAGAGSEDYVEAMRRLVDRLELGKRVRFLGKLPHERIPDLYARHHVLLSTTTLPEGLPLSMLEALCAGCAVLTTGSGGAAEIAEIAELPLFPAEHPPALARLLASLLGDREALFRLARRGQEAALREFDAERAADRLRERMERLVGDAGGQRAGR